MKLNPDVISLTRTYMTEACLEFIPGTHDSKVQILLESNNIGITLMPAYADSSVDKIRLPLIFQSDESTPTGFHLLRLKIDFGKSLTDNASKKIDFYLWVSPKGQLDNSVIDDGMIVIPEDTATAEDVSCVHILQEDGKLLMASRSHVGLLRFNTDGVLDKSFGGKGKILYKDAAYNPSPLCMALQPDKKAIFSYKSGGKIYICRLNSDGSWDDGFETLNAKMTDAEEYVYLIVVQPDGKILLTGCSGRDVFQGDHFVMRLHQNGKLDESFCRIGRIITPCSYYLYLAHSVAIQSDGKILVAAVKRHHTMNQVIGAEPNYTLIRYNPDGSLDTNYSYQGILQAPNEVGNMNDAGFVLLPDGKMIATHFYDGDRLGVNLTLVCYNTDGSLHSDFGENGIVYVPSKSWSEYISLHLRYDGRLVLQGSASNAQETAIDLKHLVYC